MNTEMQLNNTDTSIKHIEKDLELFANTNINLLSEDDISKIFELSSSDEQVYLGTFKFNRMEPQADEP